MATRQPVSGPHPDG